MEQKSIKVSKQMIKLTVIGFFLFTFYSCEVESLPSPENQSTEAPKGKPAPETSEEIELPPKEENLINN